MGQKKRFLLRLDERLYQVLEKWSADELRSVNAQIEYLLTDAAKKSGRLSANKSTEDRPPALEEDNSLDALPNKRSRRSEKSQEGST
jgi:hypothetical protein